jgi:UDP-N-acetylmuramoyl-tripeptide--D-alanyl-D-alanine ligase
VASGFFAKIGDRLRIRRRATLERAAARAREDAKAVFIGLTGSSGKSTTTELLAHILAARGRVLKQVKFNDPRSILKTTARSEGHDFVVAEVALGRANTMRPMSQSLSPDVAIVTMVALEHKSRYRDLQTIAAEKGELVEALRPAGLAVLNGDDAHVAAMAQRTTARVIRYGLSPGNDYRATEMQAAFPDRLSLTVVGPKGTLPLRTPFVGTHFWLPTLAAVATALELGVPPDAVARQVASFGPLLERCGVMSIPQGPHLILDTTKAPWHSIKLAFDVIANATATRKRIVLGHMSDFAGSDAKYRDAYRMARAAADQVIFVGEHAHRSKASQEDREAGRFVQFATPEQAARYVRETAIAGEAILIKGSVDLHLERIALAWTHDVKCWVSACGQNGGCTDCGRYEESFEWHKGRKRRGRLRRFVARLAGRRVRRLSSAP